MHHIPNNYVIEIWAKILKSCIKSGRFEILYKIFGSCGPLVQNIHAYTYTYVQTDTMCVQLNTEMYNLYGPRSDWFDLGLTGVTYDEGENFISSEQGEIC